MTLSTDRVRTLDQVRTIVESKSKARFFAVDPGSVYEFVDEVVERFGYVELEEADRELVERFISRLTGVSGFRVKRLVAWRLGTGGDVDA